MTGHETEQEKTSQRYYLKKNNRQHMEGSESKDFASTY